MKQNSKCRLSGDRDETSNHITNKCSKLVQREYKARRNKVNHWELCKKFKFDHTNNWYMHNPEFVPDNETYIHDRLDIEMNKSLKETDIPE